MANVQGDEAWKADWDAVVAQVGEDFSDGAIHYGVDRVERGAIRRYLEPLEFDCPLHYAPEVAQAHGFAGVTAPYTATVTFAMGPVWAPGESVFTSAERDAQPARVSVKPRMPRGAPPTVGYFARDAITFGRVGAVLLGEQATDALPAGIVVAADGFALADEPVRRALQPLVDRLRRAVPSTVSPLAEGELLEWARHQRILQKSEFHDTFRDWIDRVNPRFSSEVAGAFADDGRIPQSDFAAAKTFREYASKRLDDLLDGRRVLCLPTSPILPIRRDARLSEIRAAVHRIVDLTGIAALTGLPQVNLPVATSDSIPVGLSLIGWRGGDAALLAAARTLAREFSIGLFEERP